VKERKKGRRKKKVRRKRNRSLSITLPSCYLTQAKRLERMSAGGAPSANAVM